MSKMNCTVDVGDDGTKARKPGLAQRVGPLRRIVEVLRHADDVFGFSRVKFECGHEGSVSSGAIYKGRCRRCRAAAAATEVGGVPAISNPARSSPTPLSGPDAANLTDCDHVEDGRTPLPARSR
jgi:hypothetical protein